jgi:hypothetical protein
VHRSQFLGLVLGRNNIQLLCGYQTTSKLVPIPPQSHPSLHPLPLKPTHLPPLLTTVFTSPPTRTQLHLRNIPSPPIHLPSNLPAIISSSTLIISSYPLLFAFASALSLLSFFAITIQIAMQMNQAIAMICITVRTDYRSGMEGSGLRSSLDHSYLTPQDEMKGRTCPGKA